MSSQGGVLGHASAEWSKRPADQSFLSLEELHAKVLERTRRAREVPAEYKLLRTEALDGKVKLLGRANVPADLTWWSFSQLAQRVKAPGAFLQELPATLASQVLNNRLAARGADAGEAKLLLDVNGKATVRGFTGPDYSRIWDSEITERCLALQTRGWHPAPETVLADGGKTRGLYASEKDVFVFMVDNTRRIFEKLPGGGLSRGFLAANSEVGDKSFWMIRFLYEWICGNHNIWGVQDVVEIKVRHVGKARSLAFGEMEAELKKYAEASAQEDEAKIRRCMAHQIAASKEELLDKLFGLKALDLTRKVIAEAYQRAEQGREKYLAEPTSAWGFGNGLTEVARDQEHADARVGLERVAGRIFEMGF